MPKKSKKKEAPSRSRARGTNKKERLIEGVVRINQRGFGFLQIYAPVKASYLISHHDVASLMDGDKIACTLEKKNDRNFAKPVKILQRAHESLVGRLIKTERRTYFEAQGNYPRPRFTVVDYEDNHWKNQSPDTLFRSQIVSYPSADEVGTVRLSHAIGIAGALTTEIALLMSAADVDFSFGPEVLAEAARFKENPPEEDIDARKDLTPLSFCTIDGETAKDFDDAVFAQKAKGGILVKVAIADVSYYVLPGTEIDKEAYRRGSSLYFPGSCAPMIPEHLSNGLCSLKPMVPRLVMVAEFLVDVHGGLSDARFYRATIKSKARLTYKQVQTHFDGTNVDLIVADKHLVESLKHIYQASKWLRKAREGRGAIDFDSVESHVALNDKGEPVSIHPEQRLASHKVIEDLMIAANEAVAHFVESQKAPCIYRVHEAPDPEKFQTFITLAQKFGLIKPNQMPSREDLKDPKILSKMLISVREHAARDAMETLFLRSMMQARYSSENIGHFGLASKSYLHFTSPIRRYPDLVAHRVLEQFLEGKKTKSKKRTDGAISAEFASDMSLYLSDRERKIVETERNITALFSCWYMKDKVGEEDEGTIVSCTEFGVFARLSKFHVDGLLHIANLGGYFNFDQEQMRLVEEGSKKSYGIGDKVQVVVASVNIERRHIDLHLALKKKEARTKAKVES